MKKLLTILISCFFLFVSCSKIKQKTKETINKSGEHVGKSATEFIEGITEGVDQALQCELHLSKDLIEKGIQTGKFSIEDGLYEGKKNLLALYLIFEKDFKGNISVKAFDKNDLEMGRSSQKIEAKAGDARFFEFQFDNRTHISVKSKIMIE
ncbi:MAG: hypothetical protein N4A45_08605 [Flavobacteriales bacterium]|jgi:hypothetical protein|nr:hypothetical protein [Flavobacteriales bacterium]